MRPGCLAAVLLVYSCLLPVELLAQPPEIVGPVLIERAQSQLPDSEKALAAQVVDPNDARRTRQLLQQLLQEHPPGIRIVLQADPSLLGREDYLAPYPRLAAFLNQHPEIARDPAYFFGGSNGYYGLLLDRTPQQRAMDLLEGVLAGLAIFTVVIAALLVMGSLVRQAIAYRQWVRQSRVQTDVHTKILDRLQSNEELLAYVQTPAGQRFLEGAPPPRQVSEPRAIGAPFGRILWSVQAGVMLAALGIGFWFVQRSVMAEIAPAFYAMGVIAFMLGIGAVSSAGLSYVLSVRLGLLGARAGSE